MTETGSTVERLREYLDGAEVMRFTDGELRALLAVVEAAQEVVNDYDDGAEDENHPELSNALAALHSQASDEGKA